MGIVLFAAYLYHTNTHTPTPHRNALINVQCAALMSLCAGLFFFSLCFVPVVWPLARDEF